MIAAILYKIGWKYEVILQRLLKYGSLSYILI